MSNASDKAYAQIRAMILSGELSPGAQLSEESLAERCGVSRTPVRDAMRRLEADLFITRSESQRSFVARWSVDDIEDAFELRAMLEAHAAKRAASRIGAEEMQHLKAHNEQILSAINGLKSDVSAFLDHNREFHAIIIAAADSPRLTAILAKITEQPVVLRTALNYNLDSLKKSHSEHEELLAAFARRDGAWAASIMTSHIRRAFHAYADAHASDSHEEAA